MSTSVKYFTSDMSDAPELSGTAGALIAVLDACLVDGFGEVTLDSLVIASDVATGTLSTGHGFAMVGETGPVITIAGASPSELNGEWRLASVADANTFTFATSGISDGAASGTITAARSPAGWEKTYSDTNKAAYSRTDLTATAMMLRVDDSDARYPTLIMYESMSDIDTGSGAAATLYTGKSSSADSTVRDWAIYADGTFCIVALNSNGSWASNFLFGDVTPYLSGDAYHCLIIGHIAANVTGQIATLSSSGGYLSRSYTQTGSAVAATRKSNGITTALGNGGVTYPNPAGNAFVGSPVLVAEGATAIRGYIKGLVNALHASSSMVTGTVIETTVDSGSRTLIAQAQSANGFAVDITGPWG